MSIYNIIVFHYPCQDGLTSAWIAYHYHQLNCKLLEMYPISNSDEINLDRLKNKKVLFCDYCPSLDILNKIEDIAYEIKILDHHKSSMEKLSNKKYAIFDMNKSGAGLTWDYFFPDNYMPLFVKMIQDRDLWKWEIEESKDFTCGFHSVLQTMDIYNFEDLFDLYDELYDNYNLIGLYTTIGNIINKNNNNRYKIIVEEHLKCIDIFTFNNIKYNICIINCMHEDASEIGNLISKNDNIDFAVLWSYNHNKKEYRVSLRSCGDIDTTIISTQYGGGGHKNASGFTTKISPLIIFL
jgi:oligoribonuclease NrnB/cAMP/cGMP phosphodiesterase (DHH superfamily)